MPEQLRFVNDLEDQLALKNRLPRTWPAFFERHGNFTPSQRAAIPHVLDGKNVILSAPTASGKTEAVVAPLIERHCFSRGGGLQVLYITPTRALTNDLLQRLKLASEILRLSLSSKTGDTNTFDPKEPSNLLITTPESADSLLTSHARVFVNLRAIVIDELHIFDGTPRGDQLRVVLNRLREIRNYAFAQHDALDAKIQYAGLSATMPDPDQVAACYFPDAAVIQVEGQRRIRAEQIALSPDNADALVGYIGTFRERGWRKTVVFCNSRREVESYAAAIRQQSPFGDAVYVHYSNIDAERRFEIEQQFSTGEAAICFATSTLELGIDIGSIDLVMLIGAPGDRNAFMQRIGRGNRRKQYIQVACFYRTPLERLLFQALLAGDDPLPTQHIFRPAVAVQQIFSLIKQSPKGSVRLNELGSLFKDLLSKSDLEAVLGQLLDMGYLKIGRPGEWRAGSLLDKLVDEQAYKDAPLSIYSNISRGDVSNIEVRDQHTGRAVAKVSSHWAQQSALTLEGRTLDIEWYDGEVMWVATRIDPEQVAGKITYSGRKYLTYEMARLLPLQVGLGAGDAPQIETEDGWLCFHWLGDLYGRMLVDLLRYHSPVKETSQPGLCLFSPEKLSSLPVWSEAQVTGYLQDNYQRFERMIDSGAFHKLLPFRLRRRSIIEQANIPRFIQAISDLRLVTSPENLTEPLAYLLDEEGSRK